MEYFRELILAGKAKPFHDYLKPINYKILHNIYPDYGIGGNWFRDRIIKIARENEVKTILDFGCGKGSLVRLLSGEFESYGYDPYVDDYKTVEKDKVDMVVSTDFFEHIYNLNGIFDEIMSYEPKVQFHAISNRKAAQILPDGTNAHAIIKDPDWWKNKLSQMGKVKILEHNDTQNFTMYKVN
jgi:cyclopropane fatty-acyl-phospholipid synthase-like methyltransferase